MKWTRTDIEQGVRRMSWPAPSADLRQRVLSAASVIGPPITWSDRLWFSRAWRLSAAAALLAIVALDGLSGSSDSRLAPAPRASADARVVDEIGREIGLPPPVAAAIARRTLSQRVGPRRGVGTGMSREDVGPQWQQ